MRTEGSGRGERTGGADWGSGRRGADGGADGGEHGADGCRERGNAERTGEQTEGSGRRGADGGEHGTRTGGNGCELDGNGNSKRWEREFETLGTGSGWRGGRGYIRWGGPLIFPPHSLWTPRRPSSITECGSGALGGIKDPIFGIFYTTFYIDVCCGCDPRGRILAYSL
jgi:hypothetical protein